MKRIKVLSEKEKAASASEDAVNEYAEFRKEIAAMRYGMVLPSFCNALCPALTFFDLQNLLNSGLSHSNIIVLHGICLDPLAMVSKISTAFILFEK